MAVTAAFAVLFEAIGWLRGGLGNASTTPSTWRSSFPVPSPASRPGRLGRAGLFGLSVIVPGMVAAARAAYPASSGISIGFNPLEHGRQLETFVWRGVTWTPAVVAGRLLWFGVALAIALAAALFFTRFDSSRERRRRVAGHRSGRSRSGASSARCQNALQPAGR